MFATQVPSSELSTRHGIMLPQKAVMLLHTGLPPESHDRVGRSQTTGRQGDSFVPSTSGSEEEDDLFLLAKSIFDLKVLLSLPPLLPSLLPSHLVLLA